MTRPDILAGASLGALVGCLLGFSTQSGIGSAVAAVLTLATGVIGVTQPKFLVADAGGDQNARMLAFGVTATALFLATYVVAINHYLEPSPKSKILDLVNATYDIQTAQAMIASKDYNVTSELWSKLHPAPPAASALTPVHKVN